MANPTVSLNQKITDPTLPDLLNLHKKDIFLSMNCHAVATIQSFDPDAQTVTATINYKKSYTQKGPDGLPVLVLLDYPILLDVPVIILSGGKGSITFPIAVGDECLILFNDRDIDNWFQSGQITSPASGRLHSFSDGFALVGVNSQPNVLSDYDPARAVLRFDGGGMVGVGESKVKIANTDTTLNTLLQELITDISNLVTQCAAINVPSFGAPPANAAAITAIATQLSTTGTKIAGLLE